MSLEEFQALLDAGISKEEAMAILHGQIEEIIAVAVEAVVHGDRSIAEFPELKDDPRFLALLADAEMNIVLLDEASRALDLGQEY